MSKSSEHIYALLVEANPIADVETLPGLADTPGLYAVDGEIAPPPGAGMRAVAPSASRPRRKWAPVLAGALAVTAVVVAAFFLSRGLGGETTPPATAPPITPVPAGLTPAEMESAAQKSILDWNSGDIAIFLDNFAAGAYLETWPVTDPSTLLDLGFHLRLGLRVTESECVQGDWPNQEDTVECAVIETDSLSGPAGYTTDYTWLLTFEENRISRLQWRAHGPSQPDNLTFRDDMVEWIRETHPDVWEATFAAAGGRCDAGDANYYGSWCASPEAANELLRLSPEYLTQPST